MKPPRLVTVMVVVAEVPWIMLREDAAVEMVKSTILMLMVTECDSAPLTPLTVTV